MSRIRTIIVDDERDAIDVLALMLKRHSSIEVIDNAQSVDQGIELVKAHQPDLLFLDVEMPGKNGFELLNAFDRPSFKVIFVTAFNQYAIRAIKYAALDYILKPIQPTELEQAIARMQEHLHFEDKRFEQLTKVVDEPQTIEQIIITSKKGFISLKIDQIVSIESTPGNYAFFMMHDGGQFLCTKPLGHYEDLLTPFGFHRIHRSHIVNLVHVSAFNGDAGTVRMSNQKELPVAVRRRSAFRKKVLSHHSPT